MASDESLFYAALVFLYIASPVTVFSLQYLPAPYGRHSRPGWGPTLPPPLAWFLMESPTLWLTLLLYPLGRHRSHPLSLLLISPYLLHYIHRTIIYPLRLRRLPAKPPKSTRGFPLYVALSGLTFNLLNAYIQTRSVTHFAEYPDPAASGWWWFWGRLLLGLALLSWGMSVNIMSDRALEKLKEEAGGGYKIPRGGWFEVVACPNYTGEAIEWLGWAVMTWSPAALAFFLYTCSNLGPRARAHLRWYREKFGDDYPVSRKAFVPFIY